ncbi:MAG: hypothetical protein ACI8VW_003370 [bacterium]|jgi:hypothetical protein
MQRRIHSDIFPNSGICNWQAATQLNDLTDSASPRSSIPLARFCVQTNNRRDVSCISTTHSTCVNINR